MTERAIAVLDQDGKIVTSLDPDGKPCRDGMCGGCDECLIRQAVAYGYDLVQVEIEHGETLSDAVGRTRGQK